MTQYADVSDNQTMCFSQIVNKIRNFILVDGDWAENNDTIKSTIENNGNYVKACFSLIIILPMLAPLISYVNNIGIRKYAFCNSINLG